MAIPSKRTDITSAFRSLVIDHERRLFAFIYLLQKTPRWVVTIVPNWVYQKFPSFDRPHPPWADRYLIYLHFHEFFFEIPEGVKLTTSSVYVYSISPLGATDSKNMALAPLTQTMTNHNK